jgi:hypothetical protein
MSYRERICAAIVAKGLIASGCLAVVLLMAACMERGGPTTPTSLATTVPSSPHGAHDVAGEAAVNAVHAAAEDKGYIDGWMFGQDVQLYYTRAYFCAEPPSSGAATNCELGAPGEVQPRSGPIPTIYAIAAVGFRPDPATVACAAGSPCLNHPAMIDASRVGGSPTATPPSHSHILSQRGGGWFNTVNIRVFSETAWNRIAAAKSLEAVRELQGGNPAVGVPGVISADTPTNIYFFIAGAR